MFDFHFLVYCQNFECIALPSVFSLWVKRVSSVLLLNFKFCEIFPAFLPAMFACLKVIVKDLKINFFYKVQNHFCKLVTFDYDDKKVCLTIRVIIDWSELIFQPNQTLSSNWPRPRKSINQLFWSFDPSN